MKRVVLAADHRTGPVQESVGSGARQEVHRYVEAAKGELLSGTHLGITEK